MLEFVNWARSFRIRRMGSSGWWEIRSKIRGKDDGGSESAGQTGIKKKVVHMVGWSQGDGVTLGDFLIRGEWGGGGRPRGACLKSRTTPHFSLFCDLDSCLRHLSHWSRISNRAVFNGLMRQAQEGLALQGDVGPTPFGRGVDGCGMSGGDGFTPRRICDWLGGRNDGEEKGSNLSLDAITYHHKTYSLSD